jgi:hypothetical protein
MALSLIPTLYKSLESNGYSSACVLTPLPAGQCCTMHPFRGTLRLAFYLQFFLATSTLRLTTSNLIFQLNTCDYSPYVKPSLTRGWVCRLQFLLVLASAVIHGSESHGIHDHILLSQIRDSSNLEGQDPFFISSRDRVVQLYPQGLSSLFIASYDSQGYGGCIRILLHVGYTSIAPTGLHGPRREHHFQQFLYCYMC